MEEYLIRIIMHQNIATEKNTKSSTTINQNFWDAKL